MIKNIHLITAHSCLSYSLQLRSCRSSQVFTSKWCRCQPYLPWRKQVAVITIICNIVLILFRYEWFSPSSWSIFSLLLFLSHFLFVSHDILSFLNNPNITSIYGEHSLTQSLTHWLYQDFMWQLVILFDMLKILFFKLRN